MGIWEVKGSRKEKRGLGRALTIKEDYENIYVKVYDIATQGQVTVKRHGRIHMA